MLDAIKGLLDLLGPDSAQLFIILSATLFAIILIAILLAIWELAKGGKKIMIAAAYKLSPTLRDIDSRASEAKKPRQGQAAQPEQAAQQKTTEQKNLVITQSKHGTGAG